MVSGFLDGRCPYCLVETSIEYEVEVDHEWAKISCPHGHEASAYSDVSEFLERHCSVIEDVPDFN